MPLSLPLSPWQRQIWIYEFINIYVDLLCVCAASSGPAASACAPRAARPPPRHPLGPRLRRPARLAPLRQRPATRPARTSPGPALAFPSSLSPTARPVHPKNVTRGAAYRRREQRYRVPQRRLLWRYCSLQSPDDRSRSRHVCVRLALDPLTGPLRDGGRLAGVDGHAALRDDDNRVGEPIRAIVVTHCE